MSNLEFVAHVKQRQPDEVYRLLADFASYPKYGDSIISVDVEPIEPGLVAVKWVAKFRDGELRWTEKDRLDDANRTIQFEQTEGDLEVFKGSWTVESAGDDTKAAFAAEFDLGIPSLATFLGPVAGQALRETIQSVLTGFFGDQVTFSER